MSVMTEEQIRRVLEQELDLHWRPSRPTTASLFSPRASKPPKAFSDTKGMDAWPLDSTDSESDADDAFPATGLHSPGNHSIFLATPNRHTRARSKVHPRPHLSDRYQDALDISKMAGPDASVDTTLRASRPSHPGITPRIPSPIQRRSPSLGSRHSSAETMVNSEDMDMEKPRPTSRAPYTYKEPPSSRPERVVWADEQLSTLTRYLSSLEHDVQKLQAEARSTAPLAQMQARLDVLEEQVARQGAQLVHVRHALRDRSRRASDSLYIPAPEPDNETMDVNQLASRIASRLGVASAKPASPPAASPPPTFSRSIERLYDELHRLSRAVSSLQHSMHPTSAPAAPAPASASEDFSLDASRIDEPSLPTQERYEQICRAVADAMGLSSGMEKKSVRKDQIRAHLRQQEADDVAIDSLLRRLQRSQTPTLSASDVRLLEHLFEQHKREFLHQKKLYCELADELKEMEPTMDATKRRILANHVHDSIDSLEAEATRINELHAHLLRYHRSPSRLARMDG
ncbi:hypothetical protein ACI68E_001236 [Malassezia pachydermatis]|uniref:Proteophosphoglycan ppg4 n=1 Tax=Malassezia pachydermatis TaxID=77020 RepID=A0A0M8MT45_9BASI|nr:proteophosphoglycan ppg4 [Malassezia pachydermatis]KOS13091.1 proteophosphoglycan ppg4 [Malassezia pachydermatis]